MFDDLSFDLHVHLTWNNISVYIPTVMGVAIKTSETDPFRKGITISSCAQSLRCWLAWSLKWLEF